MLNNNKFITAKNFIIILLLILAFLVYIIWRSENNLNKLINFDKNYFIRFSKNEKMETVKTDLFLYLDKSLVDKGDYKENCKQLYKKMRNPDAKLVFRPPLKDPPPEMLDDFTQNGEMPLQHWYFNEAYSDSDSNNKKEIKGVISKATMDDLLNKVREDQPLNYNDKSLRNLMYTFKPKLFNQTITVIGTVIPWIEAISVEVGASKITTLDYTRMKYEQSEILKWMHLNDYLDDAIEKSNFEQFDNAASFSSLEHTGLGRYGDPLAPNGDIEAVRQVHCMLKPKGLFFLALPTKKDGSSHIAFNAHRVYGEKRLKRIFAGWLLLASKIDTLEQHTTFVLQKI